MGCLICLLNVGTLRADLVLRDPKGIHGGRITLLFKIELQEDFSPMDPLGVPDHQISPNSSCMVWSLHDMKYVSLNRPLNC